MIVTLFEVSKFFFETIYPPMIEDIIENDIIQEDKLDEERGFNEISDDNDDDDDDYDELLGFDFLKQTILFIYFKISKNIYPNKTD